MQILTKYKGIRKQVCAYIVHTTVNLKKGCVLSVDFSCVDEKQENYASKNCFVQSLQGSHQNYNTDFELVSRLERFCESRSTRRERRACFACMQCDASFSFLSQNASIVTWSADFWMPENCLACADSIKKQCFTSVSSFHHNHWEPWHVTCWTR